MDSSQPENKSIESIKAAIANGKLTREVIMKRLRGAIAQEERKPIEQQDHEQILLYDQLLYELETGKRYVSRREEALREAKAHLAELDQRKARLRPFKRIAIILAAMLVSVVGAEVLLHREWLFGIPSEDGQQYIIQGEKIDPGLVAESKATENKQYKEIRTVHLDEVLPILGYQPTPPTELPVGWYLHLYFASSTAETKRFISSYQNDNEEYLLQYEERTYNTAERARAELEQNELGLSMTIDKIKVYMVQNTTDPVCVWIRGMTYYSLYGPITKDEIIKVIKSIGG